MKNMLKECRFVASRVFIRNDYRVRSNCPLKDRFGTIACKLAKRRAEVLTSHKKAGKRRKQKNVRFWSKKIEKRV